MIKGIGIDLVENNRIKFLFNKYGLKVAKKIFKKDKLCISGGVGLNCTLNGKIAKSNIFDEIFVVPPAGDSGITLGACYLANQEISEGNQIKKRHNFYLQNM